MKSAGLAVLGGLALVTLAAAAGAAPVRRAPAPPGSGDPLPPPAPGGPPGPVTPVYLGGGSPDVVLSFMALRELPGLDARLIEVPGKVPPGRRHPTWDWLDQELRDADGRVLPNLLDYFNVSDARRVAAFGFSAGSNAGMRELLRSADDRRLLSFVACLDGLHARLRPDGDYVDQSGQIDPFFDCAIEAATGERVMVATASSIAAPIVQGATLTRSRDAWEGIDEAVGDLYGKIVPPAEAPPAILSAAVRPDAVGGWGDFLVLLYPPGGDAQQDHRNQAEIVAPIIADAMLAPYWHNDLGGILT